MRVALLIGVVLGLVGCSSLDTVEMSRKYAEAARAVGVNPVYPPREEFQIGDVFLVSSIPNDPNSAVSVWLGTVDGLRDEANAFLKSRVAFEATGTLTGDKVGIAQADMASPDVTIRDDQRVLSLPIAAFPSITMAAGMTASTGLTGAMAAFGFGSSQQTSVTLDFNDVRTYWVPKVLVATKYQNEAIQRFGLDRFDLAASLELPGKIRAQEALTGRKWSGTRCISMAIVTRVYLTRQISYTYRDRQIIAAGLKVAANEKSLATVSPAPTIQVTVLENNADPAKTEETTAKIAEALRTQVAAVGSGSEGGSFAFSSWSARGLTFKQVFQRPVAIGWEGFELPATPSGIPGHKACNT